MAKNIIEENVVMVTFEVDHNAQKNATDIVTKYVTNLSSLTNHLDKQFDRLADRFENYFIRMSKNASNSAYDIEKAIDRMSRLMFVQTNRMIGHLERLENKFNRAANKAVKASRKVSKESEVSINNLLKYFGNIEQALYRLTAAFSLAGYSVHKFISMNKDLYYLSERINMPVDNIERYAYVISQIGGDAETARQSLVRFTTVLQDMALGKNSDALEVFGRLGLSQFNKDGSVKNAGQAMQEIKQRFTTIKDTQTKVNYLKKLGFDQTEFKYFLNDVTALEQKFDSLYSTLTKKSANVFLRETSVNSANLTKQLNTLYKILNIIAQQVLNKITPAFEKYLNIVQKKLINSNDDLVKSFTAAFKIMLKISEVASSFISFVAEMVANVVDFYNSLDDAGKHMVDLAAVFGVAMKAMSLVMLASPAGKFIAVLTAGLVLLQDYHYWSKRVKEGFDDKHPTEEYQSHYDWTSFDNMLTKLKDKVKDFGFNFDNTGIKAFLKDLNAMDVVLGAIALKLGTGVLGKLLKGGLFKTLFSLKNMPPWLAALLGKGGLAAGAVASGIGIGKAIEKYFPELFNVLSEISSFLPGKIALAIDKVLHPDRYKTIENKITAQEDAFYSTLKKPFTNITTKNKMDEVLAMSGNTTQDSTTLGFYGEGLYKSIKAFASRSVSREHVNKLQYFTDKVLSLSDNDRQLLYKHFNINDLFSSIQTMNRSFSKELFSEQQRLINDEQHLTNIYNNSEKSDSKNIITINIDSISNRGDAETYATIIADNLFNSKNYLNFTTY